MKIIKKIESEKEKTGDRKRKIYSTEARKRNSSKKDNDYRYAVRKRERESEGNIYRELEKYDE